MTVERLKTILQSKPRQRVAWIAVLWLSALVLTLGRAFTRPVALPFLWAAETLYRAKRRIAVLTTEILEEYDQKKYIEDQLDAEEQDEA